MTLFTRGLSDAGAFPNVVHVRGDRTDAQSVAQLRERAFDAVVDTSGYVPAEVRLVRETLSQRPHYVFVSSVSVYVDYTKPADETSPVAAPTLDAMLATERYAGLKVACEQEVRAGGEDRACVVRPGRILGPHDSDPRAPWLLRRVAEGGRVLAAGAPGAPVQFIDARDVGDFLVTCAEERACGTFNAVAPPFAASELYAVIRDVTGSNAEFAWVSDEVLLAHAVKPYSEGPFWLPRAYANASRVDASRAVARGLRVRPPRETLRDEWAWMQSGWDSAAGVRAQRKLDILAGLSREREEKLLALS